MPKVLTIGRFERTGQLLLTVTNESPTPATFHLSAAIGERACYFEFQLPGQAAGLLGQAELALQPEQQVTIPIRVTPRSRPLLKLSRPTHHFTVTVATPLELSPSRTVSGRVIITPLVGPVLAGLLLLVLLLGGLPLLPPLLERLTTVPEWAKSGPVAPGPRKIGPFELPRLFPVPPPEEAPPPGPEVEITYAQMFQEIATRYNLDWYLLAAQADRESTMNPYALGADNDMGLMQIIPTTWQEWAPQVGVTDPYDPYSNVLVGAAYLVYVRDYCTRQGYVGDHWMLVAYNWGPNNIKRLYESQGDWQDVPDIQRRYALGIIRQARMNALNQAVPEKFQAMVTVNREAIPAP